VLELKGWIALERYPIFFVTLDWGCFSAKSKGILRTLEKS